MRKKLTLKATAMILTVSMFISGIPFNAFVSSAQEMEPEPKSDGNEIVCEIVEQRNRYSKTFMRADDTYVAVISGQALHYEDSEGNWQDIDNTLEMETNDNDEEVVTNKANDLSVEFPKTLDNDKQVTIEKSGYSISFKLLDTLKKSKSNIKNNKKQKQDKKQANTQIKEEEKSSAISYSNVMQDTDIVYDIKPQEVKESIVLSKKPKKDAVYTYRVTVPGLTAKLRDDNSIEFCAKGNADPEFIMPSPYMFDSAEAYSHDIAVTLKQETDGVYTMSYMPSNKWLKDKAREYPVTIDPTVITDKVKKNIQDTRIKKNLPNAVLGGMNTIYATSSADSAGESHALVKFNELIDVGFITKASLCLVGARNYSDPLSLRIHRITGVWDENTANYNNINSLISSEAEDDIYLENPPAYDAIYRFDITRMYHDWMVNGNNYGVAIKNSGAGNPTAEWFSSDRTETTRYPYVEIEYQTGSAMDTSYDNHQFDVGRAGTLYVNDFSGDFTLSRREMGFDGNIMPVNISMLYSPLNYSNSSRVWKTNYEWRLYYGAFRCTLIDENNVSVYLNRISTEAGKPLVFWENISQGEDGEEYSGYKLEVDGSSRKLTAPDGRVLDFSVYYNENYPYFYLPSSITKDEASVKLTWEKDKLIQILDGVNRKYVINYDTKARISAINYYGTGTSILNTVSYVYDSNNNMTSAVYPDGKSVKYAYELAKSGDSYQLKSITDTDGYSLELSYGTGTLARLNKIEEFASDGIAGNKVEITYRAYNTTFADSTGKKEIKQFNQYGQTTCTRDENGYAVFSTYSGSGKGEFMGSSDVQIPGENNLYDMDGAFVSAIGTERYIKDVPYEGGTPNWSR